MSNSHLHIITNSDITLLSPINENTPIADESKQSSRISPTAVNESYVRFKIPSDNLDVEYKFPKTSTKYIDTKNDENIIFPRTQSSKLVVDFFNENTRGTWKDNLGYKKSYNNLKASEQISRLNTTWNGKNILGEEVELTYSFFNWEQTNTKGGVTTISLTDLQKEQIHLALDAWSDVTNIKFIYDPSNNKNTNLQFGNFNNDKDQAFAFFPLSGEREGQSWFNIQNRSENLYPMFGNYGRHTFVHEIGHALGLSHPSNYNASENRRLSYSYDASYKEDSRQFTVMSYWSETFTGAQYKGFFSASPLIDDISAVQRLYGKNSNSRIEDSIYGFNSNTDKDYYSVNDLLAPIIFCVWDAGGNDTFDFSKYFHDQRIDLNPGKFSDVGGLIKNVSICPGVMIENVIAGYGNDLIIGNDTENHIRGGAGVDTIYGGLGADYLWGDGVNEQTLNYNFAYESLKEHHFNLANLNQEQIQAIDNKIILNSTYPQDTINAQHNISTLCGLNQYSYNTQNSSAAKENYQFEIIEQDRFVYLSTDESTPSNHDVIIRFQSRIDKIDISSMKINNRFQNNISNSNVENFSYIVGKIEVKQYSNHLHRIFIKGDDCDISDFLVDILGTFDPGFDMIF